MSLLVSADANVFLVVAGRASPDAISPSEGPSLFSHGLTFRFPSPHGAIDLAIAAPGDLAAFADLSAAAILKPVCLPLDLTALRHGVIHARLHGDAQAHQLAQRFLATMVARQQSGIPRRCVCVPTLKPTK